MAKGALPKRVILFIFSNVVNYTYNSTLKVYGGDTAIGAMAVVQAIITFELLNILSYFYHTKLRIRNNKLPKFLKYIARLL